MDVIRKDYNFCHLAGVLLEMGNKLSRSDLPHSDFTFLASGDDELVVVAQGDGCYTILVSVIDLPELLVVVNSEGSDLAIGPTGEDHLIRKDGASWMNTRNVRFSVDASGLDSIVVGVPESDGSIL